VSVLFFHFLANLLDFSDPNDVCSTRVKLSWQQQFVAPANFNHTNGPNHSGTQTHIHAPTHALGFRRSPQDARVSHAPTAHKYTAQSCIHFPNWIALYRTSGLPAGNNYRAPLHFHPSAPQRVNCQRSNRASRDRWFC